MEILAEELQYNRHGDNYNDGYRIVYFYDDDNYEIGEFCKTVEGFMMGFADCDPIMDNDDIPDFISIEDLLNRYLNRLNDVSAVAIYKTDGTCLQKKERTIIKWELDSTCLNDYKYVMILCKNDVIRTYFTNLDYTFFIEYPYENKDYDTPYIVLLVVGCETKIVYENIDDKGNFQSISSIDRIVNKGFQKDKLIKKRN